MIILPAIDIKDGNCVRLVRGDYGTAHKVAEDYMQTAQSFVKAGADWIHMVDLDGAKDAKPVNTEIFLDVRKEYPPQGRGRRRYPHAGYHGDVSDLRRRFPCDSRHRCAEKSGSLWRRLSGNSARKIVVGIDAKNEIVATEGWLDTSRCIIFRLRRK